MLTITGPAENCDVRLAEKAWRMEFADGFRGAACWKCLAKLLDARTRRQNPKGKKTALLDFEDELAA